MRRLLAAVVLIAALSTTAGAVAGSGPITKQNGSDPVFTSFTSICAVPGYLNYGLCGGSATTFANVTGRIDAVQPKVGSWNLTLSYAHLQPGALYRLWGNRSGLPPTSGDNSGFFAIATAPAALDGTVKFDYTTTSPTNLGFDLNVLSNPNDVNGITLVTSYWSNQWLQVKTGGLLYVP
jgi:hypothetical protein